MSPSEAKEYIGKHVRLSPSGRAVKVLEVRKNEVKVQFPGRDDTLINWYGVDKLRSSPSISKQYDEPLPPDSIAAARASGSPALNATVPKPENPRTRVPATNREAAIGAAVAATELQSPKVAALAEEVGGEALKQAFADLIEVGNAIQAQKRAIAEALEGIKGAEADSEKMVREARAKFEAAQRDAETFVEKARRRYAAAQRELVELQKWGSELKETIGRAIET